MFISSGYLFLALSIIVMSLIYSRNQMNENPSFSYCLQIIFDEIEHRMKNHGFGIPAHGFASYVEEYKKFPDLVVNCRYFESFDQAKEKNKLKETKQTLKEIIKNKEFDSPNAPIKIRSDFFSEIDEDKLLLILANPDFYFDESNFKLEYEDAYNKMDSETKLLFNQYAKTRAVSPTMTLWMIYGTLELAITNYHKSIYQVPNDHDFKEFKEMISHVSLKAYIGKGLAEEFLLNYFEKLSDTPKETT